MKIDLKKLRGIFPIIYCFFNKDNSIDKKIIKDQINLIKELGFNGIASLGLATEVNKLTFIEKKTIIETVAEYCNDFIPIAITIQGSSFQEYANLIDIAKKNYVNWIILQPLVKKNTSERDCFDFFNRLIPYTTGTIVGVQNAKEYLGVGLSSKNILKLYKKYKNFRAIKEESSSIFIQEEIRKYPKKLIVFNGRGGQEVVDNFLIGCKGIIPALDHADKFIEIYDLFKNKQIIEANQKYKNILPSIVFIMQSISSMICYGKRICAYRMGIRNVYDRKPFLTPTDYGIKKSKQISIELGKF